MHADPTGVQRLVAYVSPGNVEPSALLAELRGLLPTYMMPASITVLPQVIAIPFPRCPRPFWGS